MGEERTPWPAGRGETSQGHGTMELTSRCRWRLSIVRSPMAHVNAH
jgi:hypothetical protein